jgi:hypothetical protein
LDRFFEFRLLKLKLFGQLWVGNIRILVKFILELKFIELSLFLLGNGFCYIWIRLGLLYLVMIDFMLYIKTDCILLKWLTCMNRWIFNNRVWCLILFDLFILWWLIIMCLWWILFVEEWFDLLLKLYDFVFEWLIFWLE